ncbi:MAG: hypothetical protein K2X09_05820 [Rickettsiales bacterium]|nr:hypothetical protein [Rickettsiales bacterium]
MLRPLYALMMFLTTAPAAMAGAWLQADGQGLFIAQAAYYSSSRFYDTSGATQRQPRFSKYEFQPYVEYGATEWLTIGGSAYAQRVEQSGNGNVGLADPELFVRSELWRDGSERLSIQPLIKFGSHFRDTNTPRGGSRSVDAELSLLYGRNLNLVSPNDYFDARVGYRLRGSNRSPEWRSDVAAGFNVMDGVQFVPSLHAVVATNLREAAAFSQNGDLDSTSLKAEMAALYHLDATQWLQASLSKTVAGIQSGDGYGVSLGYARRF